jgi:hypothetical protein
MFEHSPDYSNVVKLSLDNTMYLKATISDDFYNSYISCIDFVQLSILHVVLCIKNAKFLDVSQLWWERFLWQVWKLVYAVFLSGLTLLLEANFFWWWRSHVLRGRRDRVHKG